jgi:hypothetical protein
MEDLPEWVKNFKPQSKQELLALDLARALGDLPNLACYILLARKYPEYLIRKTLAVVKAVPPQKIRKSRGALFNYLIKKYGNHQAG